MQALEQFARRRGLEYRLTGPLDGPFPILRWGDDRRLDGYARMALLGGSLCVYAPAELERPGGIDSIWDAAARIAVEVSREGAS